MGHSQALRFPKPSVLAAPSRHYRPDPVPAEPFWQLSDLADEGPDRMDPDLVKKPTASTIGRTWRSRCW
ncbi:hypothetical protein [Nocardia goodfellowii]|uniref:Uncharacterized protein n=1 Tax=Nocardia goodfellowii TaxID=882446 RepID=A0ABS4Q6Q7_9NOCA|nr:hypothetical protein [Nocardia goodfellowii]MBP2187273.1 hypothetical protein [Nocardia goodfellowii]